MATKGTDRDHLPLRERVSERLIRATARTIETLSVLLRPGAFVVLFATSVYGAATLAKGLEVFGTDAWTLSEPLGVVWVIAGAASFLGTWLVVLGYIATLGQKNVNERLADICGELARFVTKETEIAEKDLRVHVWTVTGRIPGLRYLKRRATFAPGAYQKTPIVWRKGKGAIGQCWAAGEWIRADLEELVDECAEDRDAFYAKPRNERFGLTWDEFRKSRHYQAILAWPLHGGPDAAPRVIGCLSLDVRSRGAVGELDEIVERHRDAFLAHLDACERILK